MQIEFEFVLPTGYVDEQGQTHRQGIMRRSRAMDEILPMQDPRVQANPAYATIIILSRVIDQLGQLVEISPQVIENLFASDLSYLQSLYQQINNPQLSHHPSGHPQLENFQPENPQLEHPQNYSPQAIAPPYPLVTDLPPGVPAQSLPEASNELLTTA